MTKDTPSRIRARRFLNDKILSARVQVAIDKKLGVETPKNLIALAELNVPKGPIEFKTPVSEIDAFDTDRPSMASRQGASSKHRATA